MAAGGSWAGTGDSGNGGSSGRLPIGNGRRRRPAAQQSPQLPMQTVLRALGSREQASGSGASWEAAWGRSGGRNGACGCYELLMWVQSASETTPS